MTRRRRLQPLLQRLGLGMAVAGIAGVATTAAALAAIPVGAWNYSITSQPYANGAATSNASVGTVIYDSAYVSGEGDLGIPKGGSLSFELFENRSCSGSPVQQTKISPYTTAAIAAGTNGPTDDSVPFEVPAGTAVGSTWEWQVVYQDGLGTTKTSACGAEQVNIVASTPVLSTTATTPITTAVNNTVADQASLSDFNSTADKHGSAYGSFTFNLSDNAKCSGSVLHSGPVTVDASAAGAAQFSQQLATPLLPGTYYWDVSYSGDDSNTAVAASCGEPTVVAANLPSLSTTPSAGISIGSGALSDTATVSGLVAASATQLSNASVAFELVSSCSPIVAVQGPDTVSPATSVETSPGVSTLTFDSPALVPTAPMNYAWDVTYAGDSLNQSVSLCGEAVQVSERQPDIATFASPSHGGTLGRSQISDEAVVSNLYDPSSTDTLSFALYSSSSCSSGSLVASLGTFPLSAGPDGVSGYYAHSTSYWPTAAGTYYLGVSFNSADGYNLSASNCDESVHICPAVPCIRTTPIPSSATVGASLADSAVVTGLAYPSSSDGVDFALYSNQTCTGTPVEDLGVSPIGSPTWVNGHPEWIVDSPGSGVVPPTVGTYYWKVSFEPSNDYNNLARQFCGEPVTLSPTSPDLSTTPSDGGKVGTQLSDTATLSGLFNPASGDQVSFALYSNSSCTDLVHDFGSSPLTAGSGANGAVDWTSSSNSPGFAPTAAGDYYWQVTFDSVNDPNNPTVALCGEEVTLTSTPGGGVLGASTPTTGADLAGPGLVGALALLLGGLLLIAGSRVLRLFGR